jgi:ferredoxin
MGRADSLVKLAWAYGIHQTRRRVVRARSQKQLLTADEQARHPAMIGCINCGLCAFAAGRIGRTRLPDLASSYLRLYARLGDASGDVSGDLPDVEAAAAACPVGVPLPEVAAIVRRLAAG